MGLFRLRQCCVKIGWEARLPASGGTGQLLSSGSFPVFTTDQRWAQACRPCLNDGRLSVGRLEAPGTIVKVAEFTGV